MSRELNTEANQQKTREALKVVYNILKKLQLYTPHINDASLMRAFSGRVCLAKRIVDDALSAPARNCDMGSEEEQSRRYEAFCEAHHTQCDKGCSACPCSKRSGVSCELYWAQMPYQKEDGNGDSDE